MNLTASIGVTSLRRSDPGPDAAIGRADQALYRAKDEGTQPSPGIDRGPCVIHRRLTL